MRARFAIGSSSSDTAEVPLGTKKVKKIVKKISVDEDFEEGNSVMTGLSVRMG